MTPLGWLGRKTSTQTNKQHIIKTQFSSIQPNSTMFSQILEQTVQTKIILLLQEQFDKVHSVLHSASNITPFFRQSNEFVQILREKGQDVA